MPAKTKAKAVTPTTTTKAKARIIKAKLDIAADQERFDGLVAISGLSQAEYIRHCSLEQAIKVVPDCNINAYARLGQMQIALQQFKPAVAQIITADTETQQRVLKALEETLFEVKQCRRELTGRQLKQALA